MKSRHNSGISYTPYSFRVRIRVRIRIRVRVRVRVRVRIVVLGPGMDKVRERGAPLPGNHKEN